MNSLKRKEPVQRESFSVQEQEDIGWNQIPNESERGGIQSMGRGIEVNKKGGLGTGFVRMNSQSYQELDGVTGDSFYFICKIGL